MSRRLATLLLGGLLLLGCKQSAESMIHQADTEMGRGNVGPALKLYRQAYDTEPNNPLVRERVQQLGTFSGIKAPRPTRPNVPSGRSGQGADGGRRRQGGD